MSLVCSVCFVRSNSDLVVSERFTSCCCDGWTICGVSLYFSARRRWFHLMMTKPIKKAKQKMSMIAPMWIELRSKPAVWAKLISSWWAASHSSFLIRWANSSGQYCLKSCLASEYPHVCVLLFFFRDFERDGRVGLKYKDNKIQSIGFT